MLFFGAFCFVFSLSFMFLPGPAPANYIAGYGRGASGFTTRSDIGEARNLMPGARPMAGDDDEDKHADYSESTYDKFSGYSENLFGGSDYDEADKEADSIWQMVDERMEERGKDRREKRERESMEQMRKQNPKVQLEFADLTKKLSDLSEEEWMSIPEIGDSHIRKQQRNERYVPVPDSMLAAAHSAAQPVQTVDPTAGSVMTNAPGMNSGIGSVVQDLTSVGKAQKLQLDNTLARASSSVAGQTAVSSAGYMTDLNASRAQNEDMVDLNKARDLLTNVTQTNPGHAPGWIAAARLEHIAGKITTARKIMLRGCQACPKNEDVWLEAARLHSPENAKIIFAKAVQNIPTSVKLWLSAAKLEDSVENKKRVLRKGIELVPKSVDLWKAAIELEDVEDAKVMLERAVECVPDSVDMWLALARIMPYQKARKVLNKAREAIPTDAQIWITAAQLEEAHGNEKTIPIIIARAVKNLTAHNVLISRQKWLEEAYKAEDSGSPKTAHAIVRETIGIGVEDIDRKRTWMVDAEAATATQHYHCARAIYAHALSVFPTKKSFWRKSADLEKAHGTTESLEQVLMEAVKKCPTNEILWLFAAREKWKTQNEPDEARKILQEAFKSNPESEKIWLAAVRLETEMKQYDRARALLARARQKSGTAKVFIKSVKLELLMGDDDAERKLLTEAIAAHPKVAKLWLLFADLEKRSKKDPDDARQLYQRALKNCPTSIELWLAAAKLEEDASSLSRARAILETGRFKNPSNPLLWKKAVEIELKASNQKMAETMLAKAIQECPTSGIVWALSIEQAKEPKEMNKRCVDALNKCDDDPHVSLACAKVFWMNRRLEKAKAWLDRVVIKDPKYGDAWIYLYMYTLQFEQEEAQKKVLERCVKAAPNKGEIWTSISKSLEWKRKEHNSTEELLKKAIAKAPPVK